MTANISTTQSGAPVTSDAHAQSVGADGAKPMPIQIADVMYQGICPDCQQSQQLPSERPSPEIKK